VAGLSGNMQSGAPGLVDGQSQGLEVLQGEQLFKLCDVAAQADVEERLILFATLLNHSLHVKMGLLELVQGLQLVAFRPVDSQRCLELLLEARLRDGAGQILQA